MDIEVNDTKSITVKDKFPSTTLAKFQKQAPDLSQKLIQILTEDMEVEVEIDDGMTDDEIQEEMERATEAEGMVRASKALDLGMNFLLETTIEELQALHTMCARITKEVEGFTDEEGDPYLWKKMSTGEREEFFDVEVPTIIKINMFLQAYLEKSGLKQEG